MSSRDLVNGCSFVSQIRCANDARRKTDVDESRIWRPTCLSGDFDRLVRSRSHSVKRSGSASSPAGEPVCTPERAHSEDHTPTEGRDAPTIPDYVDTRAESDIDQELLDGLVPCKVELRKEEVVDKPSIVLAAKLGH